MRGTVQIVRRDGRVWIGVNSGPMRVQEMGGAECDRYVGMLERAGWSVDVWWAMKEVA